MASMNRNHCLICYEKCDVNGDAINDTGVNFNLNLPSHKLSRHLHTIFILRKVFEIPVESLEGFLSSGENGNPGEWISLCSSCKEFSERAMEIFEQLQDVSRRFAKVRAEIIDKVRSTSTSNNSETEDGYNGKRNGKVRKSTSRLRSSRANTGKGTKLSVTDECRRYVNDCDFGTELHVTSADPFIAGDLEAEKRINLKIQAPKMVTTNEPFSNLVPKQELPNAEWGDFEDPPLSTETDMDEDEAASQSDPLYCPSNGNDTDNNLSSDEEENSISAQPRTPSKATTAASASVSGWKMKAQLKVKSKRPKRGTPFKCPVEGCDQQFRKPCLLQYHQTEHENNPQFQCCINNCTEKFFFPDEVRKHQKNVHGKLTRGFPCPTCGAQFFRKVTLDGHLKLHDSNNTGSDHQAEKAADPEVSTHKCPLCLKSFSGKCSLNKHVREIHEKKFTHKCHLCEWGTMNVANLERHLKSVHGEVSPTINRKRKRNVSLKSKSVKNTATRTKNDDNDITVKLKPNSVKTAKKKSKTKVVDNVPRQKENLPCPLCPEIFTHHEHLMKHVRFFHKDIQKFKDLYMRRFRCPVEGCVRAYASKKHLGWHMSTHEKNPQFSCEDCPRKFYFPRQLKIHQSDEHGKNSGKGYSCEICGAKFIFKVTCDAHMKIHSNSNDNENDADMKKKNLLDHQQCPHCEFTFVTKCSLKLHIRNIHEKDHSHLCVFCGAGFVKQYALDMHIARRHHEDIPKTSDDNDNPKEVSESSEVNHSPNPTWRMVMTKSGNLKKVYNQNGEFYCSLCNKKFTNKYSIRKHVRFIHEKKYDFTCEICGMGMRSNSSLLYHRSKIHKIGDAAIKRPCPIEGCKRILWNAKDLEDHLSSHAKTPKYQCSECGAMFYSGKKLKDHHKTHMKDRPRPYVCTICGKKFARKDYLPYHMKTHEKDKQKKGQEENN